MPVDFSTFPPKAPERGRVFVTQEDSRKNFVPAMEFGELVFLLPQGAQVFQSPGPTVAEVMRQMADFGDGDFILPIGDPVSIGIASAVAALVNGGRFKLLKFDRIMSREKGRPVYYPVEVTMGAPRRAR